MTGHIHAELMKQYAQDAATHEKPWEFWERRYDNEPWTNMSNSPVWNEDFEYRRKPRTININGFEVPEPTREKPEINSNYYCVSLKENILVNRYVWVNDHSDNQFLMRGLCHTTKEAAEIHAKALLSFTQNSGE